MGLNTQVRENAFGLSARDGTGFRSPTGVCRKRPGDANTVRDLLGLPLVANDLGDDIETAGFRAGAAIATVEASRLRDISEWLARDAAKLVLHAVELGG